jgi:hypothetical protein
MPEINADPPSPCCSPLLFRHGIQQSQLLAPDPFLPRARDARGRFVKGSSGGRPRGIPNPKRRVPDLVARPLSAEGLSDLLDRKPDLLRPLTAQLLPPPLAASDSAERLGIDLSSLRTVEDFPQVLLSVLVAVARGEIAPVEGARIGRRVRVVCAPSAASLDWRPATEQTLALAAHVDQYGDFLDTRWDDV